MMGFGVLGLVVVMTLIQLITDECRISGDNCRDAVSSQILEVGGFWVDIYSGERRPGQSNNLIF